MELEQDNNFKLVDHIIAALKKLKLVSIILNSIHRLNI